MPKEPLNSACQIAQPVRAASLGTAILASLIVGVVLFGDIRPNPWHFMLYGLGYSALLSFSVTGLMLLPDSLKARVFRCMRLARIGAVLGPLVLLAALWAFPSSVETIFQVVPFFVWVLGLLIAVLFTLGCYGWYFRASKMAAGNVRSGQVSRDG